MTYEQFMCCWVMKSIGENRVCGEILNNNKKSHYLQTHFEHRVKFYHVQINSMFVASICSTILSHKRVTSEPYYCFYKHIQISKANILISHIHIYVHIHTKSETTQPTTNAVTYSVWVCMSRIRFQFRPNPETGWGKQIKGSDLFTIVV